MSAAPAARSASAGSRAAYFVVRSVVEPPLRQRFNQWYSSHHLPMALSE
jgi:hypothetical protein